MIAALPMYDRPELTGATDRYWALIRDGLRARGMEAPEALRRGDAELMPQWLRPDLLLSQTCGFPYRARLHGKVQLVGTPDFGVEGCPPGSYRSVLIARADDPRGALAEFDGVAIAYNDGLSQSGWAAPQNHAAALGLRFPAGIMTGSHAASLVAVAEGRADLAALDAVTFRLLSRSHTAAALVKVVAMTDPTPGLPYICAETVDADAVFDTIAAAIPALDEADRAALGLRGLCRIPAETYLAVPTPPPPAGNPPEN
jgi:ABC-type phosphate/phosphonate transport system substrate-binding protein